MGIQSKKRLSVVGFVVCGCVTDKLAKYDVAQIRNWSLSLSKELVFKTQD